MNISPSAFCEARVDWKRCYIPLTRDVRMNEAARDSRLIRFSIFELDRDSGELFNQGRKVKLQGPGWLRRQFAWRAQLFYGLACIELTAARCGYSN